MEFIKKMNKVFKFFIFVLIIEIILGYVIYMRNSPKLSGYYVSSTIKTLNHLNRKIFKDNSVKNEENKASTNERKIEVANEEISEATNEEMPEATTKENIEKINDVKEKIVCEDIPNQNQNIFISGLNPVKKQLNFQTDLQFLNEFNSDYDFLILLLGNSETYGSQVTDDENRIHTMLQKKIRNKSKLYKVDNNLKSGKIYVVNLAQLGGMIHDHFTELMNFSKIYSPDLVIFYTGGNELILNKTIENILNEESYSLEKRKFYKIAENRKLLNFSTQNEVAKCLDKNKFVSNLNIEDNKAVFDLDLYIKRNFDEIDSKLKQNGTDYIFYIQPLNDLPENTYLDIKTYNKLHNIKILNKNFINLNLLNMDHKINYVDAFHTDNVEIITDFLLNDIWKKYGHKIQKKTFN